MRYSILHKALFLLLFFSGRLFAQSDEPCDATQLTVGTDLTCSGAVSACINPPAYTNSTSASSGVTLPALTCADFSASTLDFWYRATVPASGKLSIVVSDSGSGAQVSSFWDMAVYTSSNPAACAGSTFTLIGSECENAIYPQILVMEPAGTVVFIRMWREASSVQTANRCYSICALDPPPPPPCTSTLFPADADTATPAREGILVWQSVPGATSYNVYLSATNPPEFAGNAMDTAVALSPLPYSTTFYWRVVPVNQGGEAVGCNTVSSFTTAAEPPAPVNDECANAITISGTAPVNGSTISATQSIPAVVCATYEGNANDDVWYKITAVQSGAGTITVSPLLGLDPVVVAYSGTCDTLTNIGCADATVEGETETLTLTNLVAGESYYIRVYGFDVAGTEGSFSIRLSGVALPVTLSNLKGEKVGSLNKLSWTTLSEINNTGFELQRSIDGSSFTPIGFVPSKALNGNSSTSIQYSFSDVKPLSAANYYRLRQVDKDGRSTLSNIVTIKGAKTLTVNLASIYPNPVKQSLNLVISSPSNLKADLVVTDLAGKVLVKKATQLVSGDNNLKLSVANLPSGNYFIKASCGNGCQTAVRKFVKD